MTSAWVTRVLPFLLVARVAGAATLNVPGSFGTIQAAINAAGPGDLVAIAPGTYHENLVIGSAREGIAVEGSMGAAVTVVDASGAGVPLTASGIGSSTVIRGLTFRNGAVLTPGGGLLFAGASPAISNCIIESNTAYAGAGAYLDQGSSPTFTNCIFRDNHAPNGSGGGIYGDHGGTPRLTNCQVYGNTCAAYGGGVTPWENATITLEHCTIVGNGAALGGGNAYFTRGGSLIATNCILAFPAEGSNVEATPSASVGAFACCDLFVSSGANVVGFASPAGASGNFSLDPQFCDLAARNFGLAQSSPCSSAANGPCHLVGAVDTQCLPVPVARATWGALKAHYR